MEEALLAGSADPLLPAIDSSGAVRVNTSNPKAYRSEWGLIADHAAWNTDFLAGDLLEFKRGRWGIDNLYQHWAVYVGGVESGKVVIHFLAKEVHAVQVDTQKMRWNSDGRPIFGAMPVAPSKCLVEANLLQQIDMGTEFRINNKMDETNDPLSFEEIVKNAISAVNQGDYNFVSNNCEHLANKCRYGIHYSKQVDITRRAMSFLAKL